MRIRIQDFYDQKFLFVIGLHGRPSHRRSLQPSKENIQPALHNTKILHFFLFLRVIFVLEDPDPDPDPQHCCLLGSAIIILLNLFWLHMAEAEGGEL
jgi:hypothetical protein